MLISVFLVLCENFLKSFFDLRVVECQEASDITKFVTHVACGSALFDEHVKVVFFCVGCLSHGSSIVEKRGDCQPPF